MTRRRIHTMLTTTAGFPVALEVWCKDDTQDGAAIVFVDREGRDVLRFDAKNTEMLLGYLMKERGLTIQHRWRLRRRGGVQRDGGHGTLTRAGERRAGSLTFVDDACWPRYEEMLGRRSA